MMEVMRPRSALVAGSAAVGVSRFAMLLLVLAGFFVMHGLAATVGGAQHYSPAAVVGAAAGHGQPPSSLTVDSHVMGSAADHAAPPAAQAPAPAAAGDTQAAGSKSGNQDGSHGLMAACVFIMCAIVLLSAGRLMRTRFTGQHRPVRMVAGRSHDAPARPPPRPIYLSLCLLRL